MGKYVGMNYEENVDCFAQCTYVKSTLVYGDTEVVKKPWLTVVIPTYKRADLLKETIESVLTQWHTDYYWDIVVVDNEPYNGKQNDTEILIREIDSERILYYRNSENISPGNNFNRGIFLARGKWISFVHDDDLLVTDALKKLGQLIRFYEDKPGKPLGAISTSYVQFGYDPETEEVKKDIPGINRYLCSLPTDYNLYKITHNNVLVTAHIGGGVPSNGTIFNRDAVVKIGGFNDDFGISGDLVLFYCLENEYSVYATLVPFGFYRWGSNTMIKPESTYKTIQFGFDFREYAYSKNVFSRLIGALFRDCHYKRFSTDVVNDKNNRRES